MAAYRKISVTFWNDSYVQGLTPEGKYFYLYLMTNIRTTQCGIYEITQSQICFDTGYNTETVGKLIQKFEQDGKILYSKNTNEIALRNWKKYNDSDSPKVRACIDRELKSVKNTDLIQYVYSMDTDPQETKAKEEAKEETKAKAGGDPEPLTLPFEGEVLRAWNEWEKYRKEKRKTLTPSTREKQIQFLQGRAGPDIIEIINRSITNGWTGLFELQNYGHNNRTKQTTTAQVGGTTYTGKRL